MSTVSALTISAVVVVATMVMVVAMHGMSTPPTAAVPRACTKETIIPEKAAPPAVCSYMEQTVVNPSSQPTGTHLTQAGYSDSSVHVTELPTHLDLDSYQKGVTSQIMPVLECKPHEAHLPGRKPVPRSVDGDTFTVTEKYHQARQGCNTPTVPNRQLNFVGF